MVRGILRDKEDIIKIIPLMPSEKLKYIRQRLKDNEFVPRTDIELSPLKEEIERIFVKGIIDDDCDKIARMLRP